MRRFLNERYLILLLSLLIASLSWWYVTGSVRNPRLESATTKVVPVVPTIVGEPRFGYSLLGVQVTPAAVSIRGEPRQLETVEKVTTEPINMTGATRDVVSDVAVSAPLGVSVATGRVRVSIQITPAIAITVLRGIRVQVTDLPAGMTADLQPATVQVRVSGPVVLVTRLRADEFTAIVTAADLAAGQYTLPVRVRGPADIEVFDIQPAQVVLTLRRG